MNAAAAGLRAEPQEPTKAAHAPRGLFLWVALAGAATMIVELSAVRLVAPWFGTSARVWTNVIGVILLALALGYALGARLAGRPRLPRTLALVLFGGAASTAWLPAAAAPVCDLFLPAGLTLDASADVFLWGSLAATLLLFFLPAALLGCVGPIAVELAARDRRAGAAGGLVLAASTLGSLFGTFGTTLLLLPRLGVRGTLLLPAALLVCAGVALWVQARRGPRDGLRLALLGLCGLGGVAAGGPRPPDPPEGFTVLEAAQSPYQSIRVVGGERDGRAVRLLQVDEGLDSFQSVWVPEPGLIGAGHYYDLFALPAWWAGAAGRWRVVVLGLGAGTTWRVLEGARPSGLELDLLGVEIDPEVVRLGRAWFDLPPDRPTPGQRLALGGTDARAALRVLARPFDFVVLDAYAHQSEIPAHLASVEFLTEVRQVLAPGGWLAVNVGGFGFDDPVVAALATTAARAFERDVLALAVPASRNFVLFARRDADPPWPDEPGFLFDGPVGEALLPALRLPTAWRRFAPESDVGAVLTDDHAPLDALQRRSLAQARARLRSREVAP